MTDVQIPQIGESITTVFIARWLKAKGDRVEAGEGVVEVDSDKATMEIPAPASGVLVETLAGEGDEVQIGAVVARLDETATTGNGAGAVEGEGGAAEAPSHASIEAQQAQGEPAGAPKGEAPPPKAEEPKGEVRAGPAARAAARSEGVALEGVEGTGPRGRVTRQDVERSKPAEAAPNVATKSAPVARAESKPKAADGQTERVPMSPLRRTIARRLLEAQQTAAILTTFNECDLSGVMAARARYQDRFVEKYGIKLGFMSFFIKASVVALQEFPSLNAEIDGNDIVYKRFWNIGVAVSGPRGLVVPVLRDADRLSFAQVELAVAELAKKARDNALQVADFEGGTFTISNGGIFGSMMSTPILNPPQVGILGMHNIIERPIAVDGQVVIRPMMYLALSYDHRLIDGREAVLFLKRVKELVEQPERVLFEV